MVRLHPQQKAKEKLWWSNDILFQKNMEPECLLKTKINTLSLRKVEMASFLALRLDPGVIPPQGQVTVYCICIQWTNC